jgi:cellulose synthase/poly-beta-1,6-N-acetylglucosamine synthase-like glycosyltransferase
MLTLLHGTYLYWPVMLAVATALTVLRCACPGMAQFTDAAAIPGAPGLAVAAVLWGAGPSPALWVMAVSGVVIAGVVSICWGWMHRTGVVLLVSLAQVIVVFLCWAPGFLVDLQVSTATKTLAAVLMMNLLISVPASFATMSVDTGILRRDQWTRPHLPYAPPTSGGPMVSVHVACYNEPPDLVIGTLEALARLDYADFEVIVVDNNTRDPLLWEPVRRHCRTLGERFRFLHVAPLAGAKAGALNLALARSSAQAEIIAIVDADNQVEPDFLARLVGHFDDPRLAFIQTWYDFRDWAHSSFMTGCFWEYRFAFSAALRSYNENNAGFPMGTVCLFRRQVLELVGGWAPWCVTEDSELGMRFNAAGYSSLVLNETFGRGLIPETFAAHKKQRYRWTFGPAQAMRRHWRLYLPRRWATPSQLTAAQKLYAIYPSLTQAGRVSGLFIPPLAVAVLASAIAHGERIPASPLLWLTIALAYAVRNTLRICVCLRAVGCSLRETALMCLTSASLAHTIMIASLAGFLHRETAWRHTKKFPATARFWKALASARSELIIGCSALLAAAVTFTLHHSGMLAELEGWLALRGALYLSAPAVALLADRGIQARPTTIVAPLTAGDTAPAARASD